MAKVRVRHRKSGRERKVTESVAKVLVRRGRFELVEAVAPALVVESRVQMFVELTEDFGAMAYGDLWRLANERKVPYASRKRDDLIAALSA
jgi:hypothetical protein